MNQMTIEGFYVLQKLGKHQKLFIFLE